jgi:Helicase HerA, central domain
MASVLDELKSLASVDLFTAGREASTFVGRPFSFDYTTVKLLVNDKWKNRVGGVPAGTFLLCFYEAEPSVQEAALLRVIEPTPLPTDSEVIASMVEYYKEDQPPGETNAKKLDTFTRYEFMFSGLRCRVLGTYYRDSNGKTVFGADLENFYSAHNYSVFKPRGRVLEFIVNFREGDGIPGGPDQTRLGVVRYSASLRQANGEAVPIYVSALDFVGKRTALFGMTRTGKSNTVKKVLESIVQLSGKGVVLDGKPLKPVGQIIFDVNGEYANANQQDEGTAIFEMFASQTTRYSLLDKAGFNVMKLNFHGDIEAGFGLLQAFMAEDDADYTRSFLASICRPWTLRTTKPRRVGSAPSPRIEHVFSRLDFQSADRRFASRETRTSIESPAVWIRARGCREMRLSPGSPPSGMPTRRTPTSPNIVRATEGASGPTMI